MFNSWSTLNSNLLQLLHFFTQFFQMFKKLSDGPSVCLSIYPSVCLSVVSLPVCLSVCLPVSLSACLSACRVYLPVCLFFRPNVKLANGR